ncbi:MAG: DoxX family membrane protein [Pseudomonadota bacterium]
MWLLTPEQLIAIAAMPMPPLFTALWPALPIAMIIVLAFGFAAWVEPYVLWFSPARQEGLQRIGRLASPLVLRFALGAMMVAASLGLLTKQGVAPFTTPTLLLPDLALPAHDVLAVGGVQFMLGVLLITGTATRVAALGVLVLIGYGLAVFEWQMLDYVLHFALPAFRLAIIGPGAFSLDAHLCRPRNRAALLSPVLGARACQALYRVSLAGVGLTFVYLALTYKFAQPRLVMTVLADGGIPHFGLGYDVLALVMAVVELTAGALLAAGLLVRPVAVLLIGAFTFFAMLLGESPLLHANLYAVMVIFVCIGPVWRATPQEALRDRLAGAGQGPSTGGGVMSRDRVSAALGQPASAAQSFEATSGSVRPARAQWVAS